MTKYSNYEPGEPAAKASAEAKAKIKKYRHDLRMQNLEDFWYAIRWWLVGILVLAAIVFGVNRFVHYVNGEMRTQAAFYNSCITSGYQVYEIQDKTVCFVGIVLSIDTGNDAGKTDCLKNDGIIADLPVSGNQSYLHLCVKGKVVAVR